MACGCFPVAGDLESIREWITPGVNGLLFDPGDPCSLADAILLALEQTDLRLRARQQNARLISERAEHGKVMAEAEAFYHRLV
jgi:glycosyltransferase involved in cell wall biosynthesis